MEKNLVFSHIPTQFTEAQFALIVFPHLTVGRRGPNKKLPLFSLFNYILKCLYLGCQWKGFCRIKLFLLQISVDYTSAARWRWSTPMYEIA